MVSELNGESLNLTQQNMHRLKELFPEILTDGEKINFDMLKTLLGEEVDHQQERYQFTWPGKKETILGAHKPSKGALQPVPDKSEKFDTSENLYIEGDNLEVLKLLQKSYNGKVKVIYIDPPYNTGKDFVYKDNFRNSIQNYLEQTGQLDSEGNILSANTESNGRVHTDWLNMMYARLKLAKNLLKENGAIFISIDDNEVTNLRKICDEIFGENNFIATIVWQKKYAASNDAKGFSVTHDYIVAYQKSNKFKRNLLPRTEEQNKPYKHNDNDDRGLWRSDNLLVKSFSKSGVYPITNPNTGVEYLPPEGSCWRASMRTMEVWLQENRIYFGKEGKGAPQLKRYLNEVQQGRVPITWWNFEEVGHNDAANKEVSALFNKKTPFDTPKPTTLIQQILRIASDKDSLILDFFSGSATTAHATMQLNAEDGGKRKFIMVQLPESLDEKSEAYKDGYRTICDIGEERIRRAGEKVKKDILEKQQSAGLLDENIIDPETLDTGFKVLKLDTSNIREWNVDFENLENSLDLYDSPFVEGRSELDIVYEIMLKQGLELTYRIDTFRVEGKTIYDIAFGNLFICLANPIDTNVVKAIIARRDEYGIETSSVIFSDAGFENNDSEKLNCIELLKDAGYPEDNLLTI